MEIWNEDEIMNAQIPTSMQAVLLEEPGGALTTGQVPVPVPGPGQVLVRMAASPINPSDLGFLARGPGPETTLPVIPGIEGSGTVVAAGPGWLGKFLLGKRVACARSSVSNGTWAEYMVTKASVCAPLQKNVSFEQGAMLLVNPITALAFLDIVEKGRHAAFVNTAAASQLGRMVLRLALRKSIPLINIVRRKEQADLLRSFGAEHLLVSTDPDFDTTLPALAQRLKATLILDAIAGKFTQQLVNAAPKGSLILIYSILSGEPAQVMPNSLWHEDRRIEGFYLGTWAAKQNILKILSLSRLAQKLTAHELRSAIRKRLPLSAVKEAIELYQKDMTAGKVLLGIDPEQISSH